MTDDNFKTESEAETGREASVVERIVSANTSIDDGEIRVSIIGKEDLLKEWLSHHEKIFMSSRLWQTHLHYWAYPRSKDVKIEALWLGWLKIYKWAINALVVKIYKFGFKHKLDVSFWR